MIFRSNICPRYDLRPTHAPVAFESPQARLYSSSSPLRISLLNFAISLNVGAASVAAAFLVAGRADNDYNGLSCPVPRTSTLPF